MENKQLALVCECVGNCNILLGSEFDTYKDDPGFTTFSFYSSYQNHHSSLLQRLKTAWKILRRKDDVWFHDVVLYRDKATQLRDFLDGALEDEAGPTAATQ